MRSGNWLGVWGAVVMLLISCFEPPEYSPIPSLEFQSIVFKDSPNPSDADSLILSVRFKDGDGDLGIHPEETAPPYNKRVYYQFFEDSEVAKEVPVINYAIVGADQYLTYESRRTNPNYDTLPPFVKPYNCLNWEGPNTNQQSDTIYFRTNPNHYNIFVDFLVKQADGSFKKFDFESEFSYPFCGDSYNGRFPILSADLSQPTALDGVIHYAMNGVGFTLVFTVKTLKLRVTIQDRALNKSNTIETPEFTLQSIKPGG